MAVLTESMIMQLSKQGEKKIKITKKTVITPSAWERIRSKGIELITVDEEKPLEVLHGKKPEQVLQDTPNDFTKDLQENIQKYKYVCHLTGAVFLEKPEHMTSIYRNHLVFKNHPRIILRGVIDTFIAELLKFMYEVENSDLKLLLEDLNSIKKFIKMLQMVEISDSILDNLVLLGLNAKELREHSHNPKKFYGVDHLFNLDYSYDKFALDANYLRTKARELEIKSFQAYFNGVTLERPDIAEALNRLSSAFYIVELRIVGNYYK